MMINKESIVSDASPIISLERVPNGFKYLDKLFSKIYIPDKVAQEITRKPPRTIQEYLVNYSIKEIVETVKVHIDLSITGIETLFDYKKDNEYEGEAYALSYAYQNNMRILLDDKKPLAIAKANGMKFYNLGTYTLRAYKNGLITHSEAEKMLLEFKNAHIYSHLDYISYKDFLKKINSQ